MVVKKYLLEVLNELLEPMRKRRALFENDKEEVMKIMFAGTEKGNEVTQKTLREVKDAMGLYS